ncbi:MAG TPA: hypothetical protein VMR51_01240 [Patescibacteria group bacterium]|nr:hypothetical protein [Patescibacteria group bacterium]
MKQNKKWFIKKRGSYLPKTWAGGLLYFIYLAYIVWILVYVMISNYNFWPAVYVLVPNWIAACIAMSWVASRKS